MPSARLRRHRGEDGAVVPMVAIFLTLLITMAAFAVDLGMQRVARRDMQALADVIALDMVRQLDGRTHAVIKAADGWNSGLRSSLYNNVRSSGVEYADISGQQHQEKLTASVDGEPLAVVVEMGTADADGVFSPVPYADVPTAVQVTASTSVDFAFAPGAGGASRSAVAVANPQSCMRLGTSVLDLQTEDSALLNAVLGDILGGSVNLTAVSYEGLAQAQVGLQDLAVELGAGTPEQLLASSVSLSTFYLAVIDAVTNDGDPGNDGVIDVLQAQLLDVIGAGVGLQNVAVGQLLDLGSDAESALGATVDVLSLVTGGAFIANGENAILVPGLNVSVPGIASTDIMVQVIEPPQIACGDGVAQSSQIRVTLDLDASVLGVANASVSTTLNVGNATGQIDSVTCVDGEAESLTVSLSAPTVLGLTTALEVDLLGLIPVAEVMVPGTTPSMGSGGTYSLDLPEAYDTPVTSAAGTGTLGLPDLTAASLKVLGLDLTGILFVLVRAPVLALVNTLLGAVEDLLVNTVAPVLGLRLGNADMFGVRTAQCLTPALVG